MQIICTNATLVANTAQSIASLLAAANIPLPASGRVAGIKLQASDHDLYLVDKEGAVAMTANVPNKYGYKITSGNQSTFEESQHPANQISLGDIIVVSPNNGKVHIWAYCV